MSKTNAKSLRAADGVELVSRFAKRQPTLRAQEGIAPMSWQQQTDLQNARTGASSIVQGASQQAAAAEVKRLTGQPIVGNTQLGAPQAGAGRGFINPTPSTSDSAYPESANATRYPAPTGMPPAGAGRGNTNPAFVDPNKPMTPPVAGPGTPMVGNTSVFKHGSNTFSDSATKPVWSNTGRPSAAVSSLMDGVAQRSGQAPAGRSGQYLGMNPDVINPGMDARGGKYMYTPGLRYGGDLRTGQGGNVPGSGSGDKIPAKYEPGEFVVSNDMLDAQPELRQHLRGLREAVLAEKGMTPEQADAKALGGKTLRAKDGVWQPTNPRFADAPTSHRGLLANDEIIARAEAQRTLTAQQSAAHKAVYAQDAAAKLAAEADATKAALNKASPIGAPAAPAAAPAPTATPAAPAATPPDTRGLLRKSLDGAKGYAGGAYNAVKSVGPALVAGGAGYGAARIAQDIGNPDDSTRGTYVPPEGALRIPNTNVAPANTNGPHNFFNDTDAGRNLKTTAGALAALPGLGLSTQAASGAFKVGTGTVRAVKAAETLGVATAAGARAGMDSAPGQASAQAPKLTVAGDATMPGQDPNRPSLREAPAVDWAARKAERDAQTQKDIALGDRMESRRLGQEAAGYAAQAQPQHLGNQWEREKDAWNAKVSASSAMSGLSGRARTAAEANATQLAAQKMQSETSLRTTGMNNDTSRQTTGMNNDASRSNNETTNRTALRGQDMDYERAMAPIKLQAKMRQYSADVFRAAGGDNAKAAQMMQAAGLDPKQFLDAQAAQHTAAKGTEDLEAGKAERMRTQFKGQFANLPKEEAEYAEGLAAQTLARFASGEIVGATEGQDMRQQALLHTRALLGMQKKTKLRNEGMWNWIGGDDSMPTSIDGSATPQQAGSFGWDGGLRKGHNFVAGDYNYGDQELPADVGDDVIKYLSDYNAAHSKAQKKAK